MHFRLLPRLFAWVRAKALSVVALGCATLLHAQFVPGGGGTAPGGGGNTGNTGGPVVIGGGNVIVIPGGGIFPGGGNATTVDARIVAPQGIVTGSTNSASVVLTGQSAQPGGTIGASSASTYWWTITGGRITSNNTAAAIDFSADTPGTIMLNATIATDGTSYTANTTVAAVAPTAAGAMTLTPTAVANTTVTASVPAATNNDRTFRWTVTGDATIASGQNTNTITLRSGTAGLKEVSCAVALQNLATITLRSYLVVTGAGPAATLTIDGGSGGGRYPAGSVVDIFSDPPVAGKVFDRWTGDTAALGNDPLATRLAHASVTIPAGGATLTASYRDAATWTISTVNEFNPQRQTDVNNRITTVSTTLVYAIPAGARGLVFLLHGAGGAATDWFKSPETLLIARDLVAAGYGVAALNSLNRTAGVWAVQATLATNPDAINHAAAIDKFVRDGELAAGKPVFLLGAAAAGDAAAQIADLLATSNPARPVKGVVLYGAASTETLALTSTVAEFFVLAPNDSTLGVTGAASARRDSQLMSGRGVATRVLNTAVQPVHPGSFRSLAVTAPEFTSADATTLWTALKTAGLLDANNYLKSMPALDALKTTLPSSYQARVAEIANRLAIADASQPLAAETSASVLEFLDARAGAAAVPEPARLVNLSTRGRIAYVADSFTLGFTLGGAERATLLVRAVGPALTRFGVANALAAPRLEINRGSAQIAANEGWDQGNNASQIATAATAVGAFALPAGSRDAALLLTLDPGNYTVTLSGVNGTIGDVLAEVYDVSRNATRLRTLSALARINDEGDVVIPGFGLQGSLGRTLLLRAVGPGLSDVGVPANTLLGDPRLVVMGPNNALVGTNNNWTQGNTAALSAVFTRTGAFPLKTTNGDAALVTVFNAGNYTLQASATPAGPQATATAASTGTVLVEIYEIP